jgi:hypothetical protein
MKTLSLTLLVATLLSTAAFADNIQSNGTTQGALNGSTQSGGGNVSVITSNQSQAQFNAGLTQGAGVNAQTNHAAQNAANLNTQIGGFNTSVVENAQNSTQANIAATLPAPAQHSSAAVMPSHHAAATTGSTSAHTVSK